MKILPLALTLVAILLAVGGFVYYKGNVKDGGVVVEEKKSPGSDKTIGQDTGNAKVLSGTASVYQEFTPEDYEKAKRENKVIVLNFYATWCPVCRGEAPAIESAFKALEDERVIGFRVNFNDNETDEAEKKLAQEFAVPYQHTKIIITEGKEVYRTGDPVTKEELLETINKYL